MELEELPHDLHGHGRKPMISFANGKPLKLAPERRTPPRVVVKVNGLKTISKVASLTVLRANPRAKERVTKAVVRKAMESPKAFASSGETQDLARRKPQLRVAPTTIPDQKVREVDKVKGSKPKMRMLKLLKESQRKRFFANTSASLSSEHAPKGSHVPTATTSLSFLQAKLSRPKEGAAAVAAETKDVVDEEALRTEAPRTMVHGESQLASTRAP